MAIIAALMFLIALLYTIFEARSSKCHFAFHQTGEAKRSVGRVPLTPTGESNNHHHEVLSRSELHFKQFWNALLTWRRPC